MKIKLLADASLPGLVESFRDSFEITLYHDNTEVSSRLAGQEILLCRSTLKVNRALLKPNSLKIVATASSGRDHIDEAYVTQQRILLLDAKGCNAVSVADYVLTCIAYLKTAALFHGHKVGIIGAGAVGSQVANYLVSLGFEVLCYDPLKALQDPHFSSASQEALLDCELLCIHAYRHTNPPYPSVNLLNESFLKHLRPGTVIINASRGGIVDEEALLAVGKSLIYCTDVYSNEPTIDPRIVKFATLSTPHIAGHSIEAKLRAVSLLREKLHAYYQLPYQKVQSKSSLLPSLINNSTWESDCLALYNPIHETKALKRATPPLAQAFLHIRESHTHRHDFNCYPLST